MPEVFLRRYHAMVALNLRLTLPLIYSGGGALGIEFHSEFHVIYQGAQLIL